MTALRRLAVVVALVAGGCTLGGDRPSATIGVEVVAGQVQVARPGEAFRTLTAGTSVPAGSRIRTGPQGVARFRYGTAAGEVGPAGSVDLDRETPLLRRGELLASGGLRLRTEEASIRTRGAVRVDRGLALRVGAYEGSATATGLRNLDVGRFREAQIARGYFPRTTTPLRVSPGDAYDERLLAEHLAFEQSVSAVTPLQAPLAGSVTVLLSPAEVLADRLMRESHGPADAPLAAAISARAPGDFADNAARAIGLRSEGAAWAVVSATLRARTDGLVDALRDAIDRATRISPVPPPPAGSPGPTPRPGRTPPPSGPPVGTPPPPPAPTGAPTPPPPSTPQPSPDPCKDCSPAERLICQATGICPNTPL